MATLPNFIEHDPKPRLSERTAAQFLQLPAVEQARILHDQKYPRLAPQVFKQPYYQPALSGIRDVLTEGAAGLVKARASVQSIAQPSRRMHTMRVIESFAASEHAKRGLKIGTRKRYYAAIGEVELRLSPDLFAVECDQDRILYFNFKAAQCNPEVARMTLEIGHWLLEQNGVSIAPDQLEFIDLFTGALYRGKRRRLRTVRALEENAKLIESLWPTIDP